MVVCFLTDNNATVLAEDKQRVYESRSFILGNAVLGSKSQNTSPQHSSPQIKYISQAPTCIVTENTTFLCADPLSAPFLGEVQSTALFWSLAPPLDRYGTRAGDQSGRTRLPITANVQCSVNTLQLLYKREGKL